MGVGLPGEEQDLQEKTRQEQDLHDLQDLQEKSRKGEYMSTIYTIYTMLGGPVIGNLPWPAKTVQVYRRPNPANPGNLANPAHVNPAHFYFDIFVEFWYNNVQSLTGGRRNEIWLLMFPPRFAAL